MAFIETPRFPDGISYGAVGGPEFSTNVVVVNSGYEQRNANWSAPRGQWDVAHAARTEAEQKTLLAFFRNVGGRRDGFRFKDWADYQADVTAGLLGTGYGTGLPTYQLVKRYTSGSSTHDRSIAKPVAGSVSLTRGGSPVALGAGAGNAAIDTTTGIVTFVADASASASSITAGSTTQVVLPTNPGTLTAGQLLYLTGFSGADAALVNGLAHTINSVSGAGPYTFTLATNTNGKTITLGSGAGKKYPQASEALAWAGEFDVPARFDIDKMQVSIIDKGIYGWQSVPIVEIRT